MRSCEKAKRAKKILVYLFIFPFPHFFTMYFSILSGCLSHQQEKLGWDKLQTHIYNSSNSVHKVLSSSLPPSLFSLWCLLLVWLYTTLWHIDSCISEAFLPFSLHQVFHSWIDIRANHIGWCFFATPTSDSIYSSHPPSSYPSSSFFLSGIFSKYPSAAMPKSFNNLSIDMCRSLQSEKKNLSIVHKH